MTEQTTILAPIRYPLTAQSARTLAVAGRLAHDLAPADLRVLHVNLYQVGNDTQTAELTRAISSTLDGVEASVTTRRGFLVEEVILDEAIQIGADIVVVGANQQATWRQFLSRLLRNDPNVSSFLREHVPDWIEVMEVDTVAETPTAEPV
ncbi:universal stress protein [Halomarina halobia]|uniref:Universal stress protein n=1 Tax=Halomarina halobia TaxID=3033386 RepID=A0ABD6AFT6_9EURY|nr:universal stress protein [Halomarina sp. PSR21]